MEIIKRGQRPEDTEHRGTCNNCHTQVKFKRSEGTVTHDQRDGDFVAVKCPECGESIHVTLGRSGYYDR